MEENLIYDVGMHKGADTAHYLDAGYRVVAIEADPSLVDAARQRFRGVLETGRLTILDIAIGPETGICPFWISTNPEYNSFNRENASKWGESCHMIEVRTRPFDDILEEFGVPYYLKVDIEGADHHCLEALSPPDLPRFLSFEKEHLGDLLTARELGYSRFKLISQEDFSQLIYTPDKAHQSTGTIDWLRRKLSGTKRRLTEIRHVRRLLQKVRDTADAPTHDLHNYTYGSSGPFGQNTDGPWRSLEEVAFTWLAFDMGYTDSENPEWEDWFDVHCAL